MHNEKSVLLISMPFADTSIPSIQLATLESYLKRYNINIKTRHLYIKSAEFYGLNNYCFLINIPNDPYIAQIVFSKYVFPEHWEKNNEKFKEFFNKRIIGDNEIKKSFTFELYVEQTDKFYNWVLKNLDWRYYDIIGFTINYGQFLPSLALAKKIKELYPEKIIIFGGSSTIDKLGIRILENFNFVDIIVSGDGEDALYQLVLDYQKYKEIPRLIFRNGKEIIFNNSYYSIDLNNLPIISFDSFYEELALTSDEIKQYFHLNGRLPIEISRGCWWNNCTFCNVRAYHKNYREKNIDKIVEEINFLSDKYKILTFQIIGNTLPKNDYIILFKKIKNLGKDFSFYAEARAGCLKSNDYILLKEAGFTNIQTGIETFSQNYIKKMKKGARVIDNIAALKFCRENGIKNSYNFVINYPNEEIIDFEETRKNIQLIKEYIDPPKISPLLIGFGSPIYCNLREFNIEVLEPLNTDKIMFPEKILEKGISFFYSYKKKKDLGENNWNQLVDNWKCEREILAVEGLKKDTSIDKLIFYFLDGENFIKIYDKRDGKNIQIYILDETERKIFLACIDVISIHELQERFPDIPDFKLAAILDTFEQNGIVFHEDDCYLSLPLKCNTRLSHQPVKEELLLVSD